MKRTQTREEAKLKREAAAEAYVAENGWVNHFRCWLCQRITHKAAKRKRTVNGITSPCCPACAKDQKSD